MTSAPPQPLIPVSAGPPAQWAARPAAPGRRLAGALLVLLVEVGLLTVRVEFPPGVMETVASGRVCAALLFGLAAFLLLSSRQLRQWAEEAGSARGWGATALWLTANVGIYGFFFAYTTWLAEGQGRALGAWAAVPSWVVLALGVALTAFLAFLPGRLLCSWAWHLRARALAAAVLALGLALATPWVQGLWPRFSGPALLIDWLLLKWTYGPCLVGWTAGGIPVLGNRHLLLLVTPQCSELDVLAAFWLLAGAALVSGWREARKGRFVLMVLLGTVLMYLLNAVRIYSLVVVGTLLSPQSCVNLAHSRISGIGFLGVMLALLAGTSAWCRHRPVLSTRRAAVSA